GAAPPGSLVWRRAAIIALVVLLAGLCKESGYLLAPMLVVIELALRRVAGPINWPSRRSQFIATAVCIGVVVLIAVVQRQVMWNNIPKDAFHGGLSDMDNPMVLANASERVVTPLKLIGQAGRLMAWPVASRRGQWIGPADSPDYSPRMLMPTDRLDDPLVIGGLMICGAWGVLVIMAWRKRSMALGPLLCLPIAWAIPSNTVMVIGTIFAERLLMPVSLFVMLAVAGGINSPRRGGRLSAPAGGALIVVWAVVSFLYIPAWHDNQTLQGYMVSYHPNSGRFQAFFANSVLETAFKAADNPKLKDKMLDVAAEHARLALEYWPRNAGPYAILGVVEAERGNPRKAAEYLKYARENSVDFHIGDWYEHRIGQLESADAMRTRADALRKKVDAGETDPALAAELGQVYVKLRQWPLAYKQFEKLDLAAITDTRLLRDYIDAAITMGKMDLALAAEERWMTLKPDQWGVLTDAAILAINAGLKIDDAKRWLDKAIAIAPANAEPWAAMCMWYQFKGEHNQAVEAIRRAISLSSEDDPRYPHYRWMLDNLNKR
ncbi:MAG: tetratricopeptide repeat protein, partial [Phycisphaerales bacterium]